MSPFTETITVCILAIGLLQAGEAAPQPGDEALEQAAPEEQIETRREASPTLDELLGLEADESGASATEEAQRENAEELRRRLGEVDLGDLFMLALEKMALSAYLLDVDLESGLATQRAQLDVLAKLDQLIDRAREIAKRHAESCSGCGECGGRSGGSKPKPGKKPGSPSQGATRSEGTSQGGQASDPPAGREGDINTVLEETGTEWGHLPARVREMLKQGRADFYSGLYRKLTEEYYKRLAEEGSS
jgi:hypothetical protein